MRDIEDMSDCEVRAADRRMEDVMGKLTKDESLSPEEWEIIKDGLPGVRKMMPYAYLDIRNRVDKVLKGREDKIKRYEEIFARIWGLAMTDCGPEDYDMFPEMLHQSIKRLEEENERLKAAQGFTVEQVREAGSNDRIARVVEEWIEREERKRREK